MSPMRLLKLSHIQKTLNMQTEDGVIADDAVGLSLNKKGFQDVQPSFQITSPDSF